MVTSSATYIVTATKSGGSTSFAVEIVVEDLLNTEGNNSESFVVYPNPFTNTIHVVGLNKSASFKLYSIDGKLIQKGILENSEIECYDLPNGMYMLQLFSESRTETIKLIKH
jgi:hypothetical protein